MSSSNIRSLIRSQPAVVPQVKRRILDPTIVLLLLMLCLHGWWNYHLWNRTQELQGMVTMLNEESAKLHVRMIGVESRQRP